MSPCPVLSSWTVAMPARNEWVDDRRGELREVVAGVLVELEAAQERAGAVEDHDVGLTDRGGEPLSVGQA